VVAVFGADHIYKMDVSLMVDQHMATDADLTVAAIPVPRDQAREFGVFQVAADGRVLGFVEKPADPPEMPGRPGWCLASMGNYLFRTEVLVDEIQRDASEQGSAHDFGRNIITGLVGKGRVHVYDFATNEPPGMEEKERGYWRDVGSLDSYWEASMDLVAVVPTFNLYNPRWPIRTTYQHLPPAKFVFDLTDPPRRGYCTDSLVSPGCIISGGAATARCWPPRCASTPGPTSRARCWGIRSRSAAALGSRTPSSTRASRSSRGPRWATTPITTAPAASPSRLGASSLRPRASSSPGSDGPRSAGEGRGHRPKA
jgi:glucose-1-phosphate adenylyltransferase